MRIKHLKLGLLAMLVGLAGFVPATQASDLVQRTVSFQKQGLSMTSPVIETDRPFNAFVVYLSGETHDIEVNFNPKKGNEWESFEVHDDGYGANKIMFTQPTTAIQFRKSASLLEKPLEMRVDFIHQQPQAASDIVRQQTVAGTQVAAANDFRVIRRQEWGADENLRYWRPELQEREQNGHGAEAEQTQSDPCGDFASKFSSELGLKKVVKRGPSGEELLWPLQYSKDIDKIVVHHTDSELRDINGDNRINSRDYREIVRSIYYYHAVSRGWGDIGYNYIIDPLGNIYEGRYGGDGVIGAHSLCYNNGSLGIAIIGDYEDNIVPEPALQALTSLIGRKASQYRINPNGTSVFRGKLMENIVGHKDLRPTACPGRQLYATLGRVRSRAGLLSRFNDINESQIDIGTLDYNAQAVRVPGVINVKPGERQKFKLRFKNTGKKTWDQNTWLHVALNEDRNTRVVPIIDDKKFVAADMKQTEVAPGEIAEFEVEVEGGYFAQDATYEVAPVANGRFKVSRASVYLPISVQTPDYSYRVAETNLPSGEIFQGQNIEAQVKLRNTGNVTWRNYGPHPIALGTTAPRDRASILIEDDPARIGYLLESEVQPGGIGTFLMDLKVPTDTEGRVVEYFAPVIEGATWLADEGLKFQASITEPTHLAAITHKDRFSNLKPGETREVNITYKNRGDLAWDSENFSVTLLGRGIKVFKRSLVPLEEVKPGESVDFDFWVQAPYEQGDHLVTLRPKFGNVPVGGGFTNFRVSVNKPSLRAQIVDAGSRNREVAPGELEEITVKYKNVGNVVWRNKGKNAVHLAPSRPHDRLSRLANEDLWVNKYRSATLNETVVNPGEVGTFTFKIRPEDRGVYHEYFQLVIEQVGWVSGSNVKYVFRSFGEPVVARSSEAQVTQTQQRIVDGVDELEDARNNQAKAIRLINNTSSVTTDRTSRSNQDALRTNTKSSGSGSSGSTNPTPAQTNPTVPNASASDSESVKTSDDPIRIRLSYESDESTLTGSHTFVVKNEKGTELFKLAPGQLVKIRRYGSNIHVQALGITYTSNLIRLIPQSPDGRIEVRSWNHRPAWNKTLNDNEYRGIIEVRQVNDSTAYINELPLEDYLKGVGEVSNSAPFEKQKAMAVLARTYARFYMQTENRKFPGLPYDGSDDPDVFQKYLGYGYEQRSPQFVGAVHITEDEVVTYNGNLIKTPYFSSSDGRTRSAKEVWGWTNTPYLQSVPDTHCDDKVQRGHGVGLSGCGAEGMAENGSTYDEIIKYYYQDVNIEELNFN